MERLRTTVMNTLRRLEEDLREIVRDSSLNALLSAADPALVLPSPAVALAEFDGRWPTAPGEMRRVRTTDPCGPDGELHFSLIDTKFAVQPWDVESTEWIGIKGLGGGRRSVEKLGFAVGVRVLLRKVGTAPAEPGWISLVVEGDELLLQALAGCYASSGKQRLEVKGSTGSVDAGGRILGLSATEHIIAALSRQMFVIKMPPNNPETNSVAIDLHFRHGAALCNLSEIPRAHANATLVWNSIPCRYPGRHQAEQWTSGQPHRRIHLLSEALPSDSWKPWRVTRCGAAEEMAVAFSNRAVNICNGKPTPVEHYSLVKATGQTGRASLALSLSEGALARLKRRRQRLTLEFCATLGEGGNGVPSGCTVESMSRLGGRTGKKIQGRLLGPTFGGSDGILDWQALEEGGLSASALLPAPRQRLVGEVAQALRLAYGGVIELVDERDLLHTEDSEVLGPLAVRVRVAEGLTLEMNRCLTHSCRGFLATYLRDNQVDDLHVIPERR